jgi:ribose transport system substrate-binding protein
MTNSPVRTGRPATAVALAAAMSFGAAAVAEAADTRAALVPGGPHPYFAAWEDAAEAASEDFDVMAEYQVPPAWELSQQNEMIESLVAQGFNAFLVFPGDASGTNATLGELADFGIPSATLAGCTEAPTPALFCLGTDVYNSAYLGTKELIEAMGGEGNVAHFTGFLVDPNTQLRIDAVEKAAS